MPADRAGGYVRDVRARSTCLVAAVLAAATARGAEPPAPSLADLLGARAHSLSAYRGLVPGNAGIYLNPAGLAARRRYAVEGQFLLDRAGAATDAQWFDVSVVDSQTSAMAAGVAYTRVMSGPYVGNLFHLALAAPLAQGVFVGATGKYVSVDGPGGSRHTLGNVDVGLFWQVTPMVSLGGAAYNLFSAGNHGPLPRGIGAGIGVGDGRLFNVALDWRGDLDRLGKLTNAYGGGAEVLVGNLVPVRAGYQRDETLDAQWWSVGVGLVSAQGLALDLGYRQDIDHSSRRTFAVGMKLFL